MMVKYPNFGLIVFRAVMVFSYVNIYILVYKWVKRFHPLSRKFIDYAKTIPLEYKIKGQDDLLRKHILREVAIRIGVPKEAAMQPKKAIQYGSLIHKYLLKNKLS